MDPGQLLERVKSGDVDYRRLLRKGGIGLVALLVVLSVVLGALFATGVIARPTVQSMETEWGTVTEKTTNVQTTVVVNNPNPAGVPGWLSVDYTASMNDVTLASGTKRGIGLGTGNNRIELVAGIPNERMSDWWVGHVNRGETSTLTISGTVSGPGGFTKAIDRQQKIQTDLLGGLAPSGDRTITFQGDPFIELTDQSASWGEATAERTPMTFSATVNNVHDHDVTLDGMEYVVRMNNVTVGEGVTEDGFQVAPGQSAELSVEAALDTSKIAEWWETHVRNGERTEITVAMFGYVVDDGTRKRVPLEVFSRQVRLTTDMLGDGSTSTESITSDDDGRSFSQPAIEGTERRWGEVTDARTPVVTTTVLNNSNGEAINDLLSVRLGQRITINDVLVANDSTTVPTVSRGENNLDLVTYMDNSKVPKWWVKHINQGEQSTMVMTPTAVADLEFTKIDVPVESQRTTASTNMLSGLNNDDGQAFSVDEHEARIVKTRADWTEADLQRSKFEVRVTIVNDADEPITVRELDYRITMNDVLASNRTAPESYTIQPGETRTVTFTLSIDTQKTDEWWVSHIRNGERTVIDFTAIATVEADNQTERVEIRPLSTESVEETDFLNQSA